MPRQRQRSSRAQADTFFVIADPSSSRIGPDNLSIVRSHVGRWRWRQVREKLERGNPRGTGAHDFPKSNPSSSDQAISPNPNSNEPSIVIIPGDLETDADVLPLLLPEPGVSEPIYIGHEILDRDVSKFSHQEVDTNVSEVGEEQNTRNGDDHGSMCCVSSISLTALSPFQTIDASPLSLSPVSSANKYSLSVLWPGLMPRSSSGANHIGVQRWFVSSACNPALHSAMLFGSYSHRRALCLVKQRGHFSAEDAKRMAICEADAIAKINRVIKNPAKAVTDELILCVLCMAMNKSDHSSSEQITESPFNAPLRSLQWLDVSGLLGASRFFARPTFPYISIRSGTRMSLKDILGIDDLSQNQRSKRTNGNHVVPEMHSIFRGLRIYVEIVEAYQDGIQMGMDTLRDYRNVIQWHIMSLLPSTQLGSAHIACYPLYEACRLALIAFGVGITFPLPPQAAPLTSLARMLRLELQIYSQGTQNDTLEVQLLFGWCLVVGGITGKGSSERSWYASRVQLYASLRALSSWYELKAELSDVLWFDDACDLAGKMLWDEAMSL